MNFSTLNEILLAILIGVVQGITEFLPISSTAHILLASKLATGRDIGLVASNIIQFGTILAVISYFWKDLVIYFKRVLQIIIHHKEFTTFWKNFNFWWGQPSADDLEVNPNLKAKVEAKLEDKDLQTDIEISQIIVSTIPIIVLGVILYNFAESSRTLPTIASFLIAGAVLMGFAEWAYTKSTSYPKTKMMTAGEIILIGLFQSLAIFPGISRSGSTISGALFLGRNRKESVRFSFLLSLPAIILAGTADLLKLIWDIFRGKIDASLLPKSSNWGKDEILLSITSIFISFVVAYLVGLGALRWLINFLSKHTFRWFIVYRIAVGLFILVSFWLGVGILR
jgi:undecaprenyl-diphosphatase